VQSIEYGDSVQLTANSNTGYVFDHWEGSNSKISVDESGNL